MKIPEKLFVLPFDHQTGLFKEFGWMEPITDEQVGKMKKTRDITYQGYLYGLSLGIPKEQTAILTDDVYGINVIASAQHDEVPVIYTLEKSGQPHLEFTHPDWQQRIAQNKPDWIKTLVRYNPEANSTDLQITTENLKLVSDYAHEHDIPFMVEPLVPPTEEQKGASDYDHQLRPGLTVRMIHEVYGAGIFPTIWKIEGSDDITFYNQVADTISTYDQNARIVVLGRNETIEGVSLWLQAGAKNPSVIGFAIGRTVFLDAIKKYLSGEYTNDDAIKEIGERYYQLYKIFTDAKTHV